MSVTHSEVVDRLARGMVAGLTKQGPTPGLPPLDKLDWAEAMQTAVIWLITEWLEANPEDRDVLLWDIVGEPRDGGCYVTFTYPERH